MMEKICRENNERIQAILDKDPTYGVVVIPFRQARDMIHENTWPNFRDHVIVSFQVITNLAL